MNGEADPSPPRVELFGAPRVVVAGRSEPLRPGKKPLALLAYLVAHAGEEQSREKIAALLWPDRFEEQARQSLRQALTALRKLLGEHGDAIVGSSDGLISVSPAALSSDLAEFDRLARGPLDDLLSATALYRGDFLAQLGSVSDPFDAWAMQERERRRTLAVKAIERAVEQLQAAGRDAEALALTERLVAIDPAHEPGHRTLMSLYAAAGQRTAALRQFEDCRAALARHLDAEPDAATVALHRAIRESAVGGETPAPSPTSRPTAPSGASPSRATAPPLPLFRPAKLLRFALRRRLVVAAGAAALLAGAVWWFTTRPPAQPAAVASFLPGACLGADAADEAQPVLIVLPLRSFGEDEDLARFAAAATDRIQTVSSLVPGVAIVIGPPPGHPDLALSSTEIAAQTGATHVLEGSVRRRGERVQATVRLVDGRSGRQIWQSSTRHDAPASDPLVAQDDIALIAAGGVQEQLTEGRQALAYRRFDPGTLELWEHNTRGYGRLNSADRVAAEEARGEFEAALALNPGDPGANTGLAFTHLSALLFGWSTDADADLSAARGFVEAALAAKPDHPPALGALSFVALFEGDYAEAVESGETALRLSGGGGDAAAFLAYVLSYTDDSARSVELARRALRARPYAHPIWYEWTLARALRLNGDPDAAIDCLAGVDLRDAGGVTPAVELALARAAAGDADGARSLVSLIEEQTAGAFSSADYCRIPPPQNASLADACAGALTAVGLPE